MHVFNHLVTHGVSIDVAQVTDVKAIELSYLICIIMIFCDILFARIARLIRRLIPRRVFSLSIVNFVELENIYFLEGRPHEETMDCSWMDISAAVAWTGPIPDSTGSQTSLCSLPPL